MAETAEQPHADENGAFAVSGAEGTTEQPAVASADGGSIDWICPKCGNANYSHRSTCNMRKCRFPRDGDPTQDYSNDHSAPRKRGVEDGGDQSGSGEDRGKRGKLGENWNCKKCGNENFASRTHCNMRKCREPREEWVCASCGNVNFKYRSVCNMRKCGAPRPGMAMQGAVGGMGMGMGGMGMAGRGFSTQYGTDATANAMAAYSAAAYGMGAGEQGLDAYGYNQFLMGQNPYMGFPQQPQGGGQGGQGGGGRRQPQERKEGDWACEKCGNFNFASRTKCNMRNCQEPRKEGQ